MAPQEGAIHLIKLNAVDPLAFLTLPALFSKVDHFQ
jgi:hypothetical protein